MKTKKIKLVMVLFAVLVIVGIVVAIVIHYTPSKKVMPLTEYYPMESGKVMLVMQDEIVDTRGVLEGEEVYLPLGLVKERINNRFYWDANESLLIYTTPTEVLKAVPDTMEYQVNKEKRQMQAVIVKVINGEPYLSVSYMKQFSACDYQLYRNPDRLVIQYRYGEDMLCTKATKATQIRVKGSIKADILKQVKQGDEFICIDADKGVKDGFGKVMAADGVIGYIKISNTQKNYYKKLTTNFKEPEYSHITKDYKICMAWHQVTNMQSNNSFLTLLNRSRGLNTISPTWFTVKNNEGELISYASERYVSQAHEAGLEVWALCNDFAEDMKIADVLNYTSRREHLENELIAQALKLNLDGINIDFEYVKQDSAEGFIEFIRELSIKCRSNGIVLSIDNYSPTEYTAHYNRREQGTVADYIITMAYDEHYNGCGSSGSVASLPFITAAVMNTLEQVPAERTIIALPFYTRVWSEKTKSDGSVEITSRAFGMDGARKYLSENGVESEWDATTSQNYAEFKLGEVTNKVWLEDEESLEEKMKVVADGQVAGMSFWKLGLESEAIWNVIMNYSK